ncbi:MAG: branched-chain-amino-acid transaminase [Moraxellaceae bacterium]|nr:MAG: branched-chain-amino-acid transaminase [Moraxellaceae bacterium]
MPRNTPKEQTICWINGKRCLPADAKLSIFDHGVLYGDGIFEGIRFYQHKSLLLNEHLERLRLSAKGIDLDLPYSTDELAQSIENLCQHATFSAGYIRLVVTRGEGALGLNPLGCGPANVFIILAELGMMPTDAIQKGITTIIAKTRRTSPSAIDPTIKSLNYLNNILAKQEANRAGVNEAILLNDDGNVAEAVAENIFIYTTGKLITPPCSDGALNGITRSVILRLADQAGISTVIRSISESELIAADEIFLSGTGAELVPVRLVNGVTIKQCPGPIFIALQNHYTDFIRQQCH